MAAEQRVLAVALYVGNWASGGWLVVGCEGRGRSWCWIRCLIARVCVLAVGNPATKRSARRWRVEYRTHLGAFAGGGAWGVF